MYIHMCVSECESKGVKTSTYLMSSWKCYAYYAYRQQFSYVTNTYKKRKTKKATEVVEEANANKHPPNKSKIILKKQKKKPNKWTTNWKIWPEATLIGWEIQQKQFWNSKKYNNKN